MAKPVLSKKKKIRVEEKNGRCGSFPPVFSIHWIGVMITSHPYHHPTGLSICKQYNLIYVPFVRLSGKICKSFSWISLILYSQFIEKIDRFTMDSLSNKSRNVSSNAWKPVQVLSLRFSFHFDDMLWITLVITNHTLYIVAILIYAFRHFSPRGLN